MYGIKQTSKWKVVTLTKLQHTARPPMLLTSFVKTLVRACRSNPWDLSSRDARQTQLNLHILCCIWCSSPVATRAFVLETHELVILQVSACSCFPCPFPCLFTPFSNNCFHLLLWHLSCVSEACLHLLLSDDPSIYPPCCRHHPLLPSEPSFLSPPTQNGDQQFSRNVPGPQCQVGTPEATTSWDEEQLGSWPLHWAEKPCWTTLP